MRPGATETGRGGKHEAWLVGVEGRAENAERWINACASCEYIYISPLNKPNATTDNWTLCTCATVSGRYVCACAGASSDSGKTVGLMLDKRERDREHDERWPTVLRSPLPFKRGAELTRALVVVTAEAPQT